MDRLLNAGHSAMHEVVAELFDDLPDWLRQPEESFAVYGERGVIDVLCFHSPTGSLLVKTEIVDVQDLVGGVDRKTRLAARGNRVRLDRTIDRLLGDGPDTRTDRRRVAAHWSMLRSAFPADGHAARSWLAKPRGNIRALSFMTVAHDSNVSQRTSGVRRVRKAA